MKATFTTSTLPTECWVYEKHMYRYYRESINLNFLPYTYVENAFILKANGISYRKSFRRDMGEVIEYWDSEEFEEKDLTLPLYTTMSENTWRYCGRNYTGKIVSEKTANAAIRLKCLVDGEIEKYQNIISEVSDYQCAKEKLGGKLYKVCRSDIVPSKPVYEIDMNHDSFVIFGIRVFRDYSNWVVIFDRNQIATDTCIEIEVPKHIAGMVIGRKGCNIKHWAEFLNVKYIKVISV